MNFLCQRLSFYASIIVYGISISLIAGALISQQWIQGKVVNSKVIAMVEGKMHAGLFSGVRVLDWGLGVRTIPFSVLSELEEGTSFFGRGYWFGTVSFTAFGMLFILLAMIFCLIYGMKKQKEYITPYGIMGCTALAMLFLSGAALLFYINFSQYMIDTVLLDSQIDAGFSTKDKIWVGYSFQLFIASIIVLLLPFILLYLGRVNCFMSDRVMDKTEKKMKNRADSSVFHY